MHSPTQALALEIAKRGGFEEDEGVVEIIRQAIVTATMSASQFARIEAAEWKANAMPHGSMALISFARDLADGKHLAGGHP